jgi:hypothetical protein
MGGGRSEGAKVNVKVGPRARALQEDKGEFGVRGLLHLVPVKRPAASYLLPRPGRDIAPRMSYPLVDDFVLCQKIRDAKKDRLVW